MIACAIVLLNEQAEDFLLSIRAGAACAGGEKCGKIEGDRNELADACGPPSVINRFYSFGSGMRVSDRQLLLVGERLYRDPWTRDRHLKHLSTGGRDNTSIGIFTPDLFDFTAEISLRSLIKLIPTIEQQQYAAIFDEVMKIVVIYIPESGPLA